MAHVCKIALGSVPNLSNYSHFFLHFVVICCDISEKRGFILFIIGTVIRYDVLWMHVD